MTGIVILVAVVMFLFMLHRRWRRKNWIKPKQPISIAWTIILSEKVDFYSALAEEEKRRFEYKVQEFLLNFRITGIDTTVDLEDKLLVAASAVIPIFEFKDWQYTELHEVLVYPGRFNDKFNTSGENRNIMGMVGTGYMDGKMILSRPALRQGFAIESDKKNTAIHEFVHLIDKQDGALDGIPSQLLEKQYVIPWLDLINKKIEEIYESRSDINPYGGTNRQEFFAVTSEYFFERPKLLAKKHPQLYDLLEKIFHQKMTSRDLSKKRFSIGRNSSCPCKSGLKFKNCCGSNHYK